MRFSFAWPLLTAFAVAGCAHKQEAVFKPVPGTTHARTSSSPAAAPVPTGTPVATTPDTLIVTPAVVLTGKVMKYNDAGRFIVANFPVGHMPAPEQRMFVYRAGLKVGEVKFTTWHKDDHIVADLTSGEAQAGDEVRDR